MQFYDPRPLFTDTSDYILIDEIRHNVKKPTQYGVMPTIELPPYLKAFTDEETKDYWKDIHDDQTRIYCINDVILRSDSFSCPICDYCTFSVEGTPERRLVSYWMCNVCHTDMCGMCYEEVDEATAIKNGAKNWQQRREKMDKCRAHGLTEITHLGNHSCDVCSEEITSETWLQSVKEDGETVDICNECEPTDDMKELKFETYIDKRVRRADVTGFGSLLDWIPVAHDLDDHHGYGSVFICMNPDSPSYLHVAICHADDHGRNGVFDLGISWDEFVKKSEDLVKNGHPNMRNQNYICNICMERIKDESWQQAYSDRDTIDICTKCLETSPDSKKVLDLQAKHAFYRFPPGDPVRNAKHIIRIWMCVGNDPMYYG